MHGYRILFSQRSTLQLEKGHAIVSDSSSLGSCALDLMRLTGNQIIHSVETAQGLSRHDKVLRKRIEESILQSAANDDREIDEAELKRLVFLEESSKKVRTRLADKDYFTVS